MAAETPRELLNCAGGKGAVCGSRELRGAPGEGAPPAGIPDVTIQWSVHSLSSAKVATAQSAMQEDVGVNNSACRDRRHRRVRRGSKIAETFEGDRGAHSIQDGEKVNRLLRDGAADGRKMTGRGGEHADDAE
jgi:hypothetical protein